MCKNKTQQIELETVKQFRMWGNAKVDNRGH
jgi:hypothetical protein